MLALLEKRKMAASKAQSTSGFAAIFGVAQRAFNHLFLAMHAFRQTADTKRNARHGVADNHPGHEVLFA